MGAPPRSAPAASGEGGGVLGRPEQLDEHVDFGGLSLQDFVAEKTAGRQPPTSVHTYSAQSVEECTCLCPALPVFAHCASR